MSQEYSQEELQEFKKLIEDIMNRMENLSSKITHLNGNTISFFKKLEQSQNAPGYFPKVIVRGPYWRLTDRPVVHEVSGKNLMRA